MHFYDKDGKPVYEIPTKTGGMKPTTIEYAFEHGLFPSVTEVDKAIYVNEGLNIWIKSEIAKWCYNNPPEAETTEEEYLQMAMDGGREKSTEAMDFGTILHDAIESRLKNGNWEGSDISVAPWIPYAEDYISERIHRVIAAEKCLTCKWWGYGVGGKIDLVAEYKSDEGIIPRTIMDWKTQGVKTKTTKKRGKEKVPMFYDSWIRQLAMYSFMESNTYYSTEMPRCVSVIIDSKDPSPFVEKLWSKEEQSWGLTCATKAVELWHELKFNKPKGKK